MMSYLTRPAAVPRESKRIGGPTLLFMIDFILRHGPKVSEVGSKISKEFLEKMAQVNPENIERVYRDIEAKLALGGKFKDDVKKGEAPKTDVEKVRAQKKAFDETEKELAKEGQISVRDDTALEAPDMTSEEKLYDEYIYYRDELKNFTGSFDDFIVARRKAGSLLAEETPLSTEAVKRKQNAEGGVVEREGYDKGGAVETEIQEMLNKVYEGLDFDEYYYGVSPKDKKYNSITNMVKRKRADSSYVPGKEAMEKRSTKLREDAIKKFNAKKTDKPIFSQKLNLVKFKDAEQEEKYLKLLVEKRSQPKNVSKITNKFLAKEFGIKEEQAKQINSILKDRVDSFVKGEDYYKQTGQVSPTKIRDLKAQRRRREAKKQLEGNVDIASVKESGIETHHIMPFGGKEKTTAQGLALIDKQMNVEMAPYEIPILRNAERIKEIESQYGRLEEYPKEIQEEIKKINMENRGYVELAKKNLPKKYHGLIGYYEYDTTDVSAPLKKKGINPNKSVVGFKGDDFILKDNPKQSKQLAKQIRETTADIAGTKELQQIKQLQSNIPVDNILQNIAAGKESQAGFMRPDLPLELAKGAGKLGLKALGPLGTVAGTVGLEGYLAAGRPIEETVKDPLTGLALILPEAGKNVVKNARLANMLNLGMKASTLARMTPIGLGITGAQLGYKLYEKGQEQKAMIDAMTPHQRDLFESQMEGEALVGEAAGFKTGGPVDKKSKKDLPGQKDPNLPIDPSRRDFLEGSGALGLGALLAAKGFMKFGPDLKKTTQAAKVSPFTKVVAPLGKTETEFPQWFPGLINKVRKEGTQTPIYGSRQVGISEAEYNNLSKEEAKDYYDNYMGRTDEYIQELKAEGKPRYIKFEQTDEIIGYKYQLKDRPELKVSEYRGEDVYVEFPNDYQGDVFMEYTAPKGNKDAQFSVTDARPETNFGGQPFVDDHTDFYPETVDNIDEVYGGVSGIEQYALGAKKARLTKGDEVAGRGDAIQDVMKDVEGDLD